MPDFSDARYKGLVIWMDSDQLEETYPDAEDVCQDCFASHSGTTYDDRPGSVSWQDSTRQRCRVAQCHWVEKGEWWEVTYTRAGILVPPQRSPLKDRKGKAACRLIMQSAYVDRENKRFGIVRDMISPKMKSTSGGRKLSISVHPSGDQRDRRGRGRGQSAA